MKRIFFILAGIFPIIAMCQIKQTDKNHITKIKKFRKQYDACDVISNHSADSLNKAYKSWVKQNIEDSVLTQITLDADVLRGFINQDEYELNASAIVLVPARINKETTILIGTVDIYGHTEFRDIKCMFWNSRGKDPTTLLPVFCPPPRDCSFPAINFSNRAKVDRKKVVESRKRE